LVLRDWSGHASGQVRLLEVEGLSDALALGELLREEGRPGHRAEEGAGGVRDGGAEAEPAHGGGKRGLSPLRVRGGCRDDPREGVAHEVVKVLPLSVHALGVHRPEDIHNLGQGEAGPDEGKLGVGVHDQGKAVREILDVLDCVPDVVCLEVLGPNGGS
jgi:hypothetical protein